MNEVQGAGRFPAQALLKPQNRELLAHSNSSQAVLSRTVGDVLMPEHTLSEYSQAIGLPLESHTERLKEAARAAGYSMVDSEDENPHSSASRASPSDTPEAGWTWLAIRRICFQ
jgi:hypothetical protein